MRSVLLIGLACLMLAPGAGHAQSPGVSVCLDPEPPPAAFWKRDANRQKSTELVGTSVEIVRAAFARMGKPVDFVTRFPWARCMAMVEGGQIDFASGAYFSEERAQRFAYTLPYAKGVPQVFFLAKNPLVIRDVADLKRHRGCGLVGASYTHYGLLPADLDLGVGYDSLFRKLKAQRCAYFVEELAAMVGLGMIGEDYLSDPEIRHEPVPGAVVPASHLITAKEGPSVRLIPEFNRALTEIIQSGEAAAIWKKYGMKRAP